MIVVKIEMWPLGDEARKYHLGEVRISNDATGGDRTGNYDAVVIGKAHRKGAPVRVEGFPRLSKNVFHLLARVLAAAGYK